jgi:hypothetical protein
LQNLHKAPDFPAPFREAENLSYGFNALSFRLKYGQYKERGRKQGKFRIAARFLTEFSTENGDSFALAPGLRTVQRQARIKR